MSVSAWNLSTAIGSIKSNDVKGLIAALPQIENINARVYRDESLLHVAARFGNPRVVTLLLEQHADIESLNVDGESSLIVAVANGHAEVVGLLLQAGARMSYSFQREQSEFEPSLIVRRREELRQRLKSEDERAKLTKTLGDLLPLLDRPDEEFLRAQTVEVHAMDCCNDFAVLKVLVEEFLGNPNHCGSDGYWPLWRFVEANNLDAVRWLLSHGAHVDQCSTGATALFAALQNDRLEMIGLLLEAGANANQRDCDDCVPLGSCRSVAAVQLMLEHGADPSLRDQCDCPCWQFIEHAATRQMLETIASSVRALP